jgi:hypothetical protein
VKVNLRFKEEKKKRRKELWKRKKMRFKGSRKKRQRE